VNRRMDIEYALVLVGLIGLILMLALGCSATRSGPRVPPAHRGEVDRAMAETSRKLGMAHKGGWYSVAFREGTAQSNIKGRMGKQTAVGVALGTTDSRGNVVMYMTAGAYRFEDLVHEMAHVILISHGVPISPEAVQHDMMKAKGFRW
jgi:hypothetical protein